MLFSCIGVALLYNINFAQQNSSFTSYLVHYTSYLSCRERANITKPLSLAHLLFVHSPVNNFWAVTDYSSISHLQIETHGQKDLHPPHHLYRVPGSCFINGIIGWCATSVDSDHFWRCRYCGVPHCFLYLDA